MANPVLKLLVTLIKQLPLLTSDEVSKNYQNELRVDQDLEGNGLTHPALIATIVAITCFTIDW